MSASPEVQRRSRLGWNVLLTALSIEAFGGLALLVPTVLGMLNASGEPLGARLSIFISALLAWIWVCVTLFGGMKTRASWARGSAITIHVLLFAAGTGMLQLGIGQTGLAWTIVLLALIGFFAAIAARPEQSPVEAEADGGESLR